jgi:hypothetical protein
MPLKWWKKQQQNEIFAKVSGKEDTKILQYIEKYTDISTLPSFILGSLYSSSGNATYTLINLELN